MPKKYPSHENEHYRNVRAGKMRNAAVVAKAHDLADDRRIFDLKQQGLPDERIAEEIGVSTATVNNRLNRIFREYRTAMTGDVEARAGELISQYEYIVAESLDAWRQSKADRRSLSRTISRKLGGNAVDPSTGEVLDGPEDPGFESITTGASAPGPDVKYLSTAMSAMEKLSKLLRIDAPQQVQVQVSGPNGGPVRFVQDVNYDEMEGEKLGAYLRGLADAAMVVSQPLIDVTPPDAILEAQTVVPAQSTTG
jgi:DNA-binding CsgD family transcriptional regulator